VNITDPSGVVSVLLSYHNGTGWTNVTMVLAGDFYIADVPPCPVGTVVTLKVYACDSRNNWGVSPLDSYIVASSDLDGPQILLLEWAPYEPTEEDTVIVYVELSDVNGILQAILSYGYGAMFVNASMSFDGSGYEGTIVALPIGTQVSFCIYSCDNRGNWAVGEWAMYFVIASDSSPPTISGLVWSPSEPLANESIEIRANIEDENPISMVLLEYFDGSFWRNLTMQENDGAPGEYFVRLPAIGNAVTIQMRILAQDSKGNWGSTSMTNINVQSIPHPPPPTEPTIPIGDILVIGAVGALGLGVPIGLVIGLVAPRILKRRNK